MEAQKNLKPLQVCNYKPILKVCMAYLEYGTFQVTLPLNPNPDDWGHIWLPETLNRNNSKWSEVKILFILDLFIIKVL